MKQIIILLSFCLSLIAIENNGFGENYDELNMEQKRQVFFSKMNHMFDITFENVKQERAFVLAFLTENSKNGFRLVNKEAFERLLFIKNKYRIDNLFDLEEYKKRIAVIPKSMGIAQALVESATGTSRFAKEANNLFGEWTWGEKGLIPDNRQPNKKHKIRIFDTLQDSVDSYVLNLNRHYAYEDFRNLREKFLKEKKEFSGLEAIKSLNAYSERKGHYIALIIKIIKRYNLEKYDYLETQSPFIKG